jgi:pimeloyl-ACP methyl ester carboxylesterase
MDTRFRRLGFAALVWITGCGAAAPQTDVPPPAAPYIRPQTAVRLPDGRRFNMVCMGKGVPVAILAAGGDDWSPAWDEAQPQFAKITRTCAFDRAGYGFSDPGPMPRDATANVSDLHQALKVAGLPGPFVLVGHSLGGLEMRLFAYEHPELVSGLLLIDPAIEDANGKLFLPKSYTDREIEFARYCEAKARAGKIVAGEVRAGDPAPCAPAPLPQRTAEETRLLFQIYAQPSLFEAFASELESDGRSSDEVKAARRKLGAVPLIVLSEDKVHLAAAYTEARLDADPDKAYANWISGHEDEARDSTRGEHRIVDGAGHWVYGDRPDAVITAFREVVEAARASDRTAAN